MKNSLGEKSEIVAPMGSEISFSQNPTFKVRAVGAFKQKPGCPDKSVSGIGAERLQRLCKGECYHPSSERKKLLKSKWLESFLKFLRTSPFPN
ncbi:hypothetical protein LEP1GSC083_4629 [Leptospira interrogans serovar Pyrogenes str. L0374]|uniref:Uncharacterized protein n=1 Tax=Leptospira interrogans serovar Pyrogenes str. L0374 TaxID=1049928 RepID=M6KA98_LEPIR|nr:hypothetical protein LEP1GSC083_4629 [Leptospira interrogans serovar Pyrogenes str. L0374]